MREFNLIETEELSLLLALKREAEITPAQLARLDFLLEQRGLQIDAHLQSQHYQAQQAA